MPDEKTLTGDELADDEIQAIADIGMEDLIHDIGCGRHIPGIIFEDWKMRSRFNSYKKQAKDGYYDD